ncbi:MAG: hypothetical protein KGO93_02455 [Cyanobacteria bacterium REEB446]|nr:hypothetical protein [Cyanobacteria bacterium REEB446]
MVGNDNFRIPDANGAAKLFRERQVQKPSYGAVGSQDSLLSVVAVNNQQQTRRREILEFASKVEDAGGVNNSISRPQTSAVNPLSQVITDALAKHNTHGVTVYSPEDIPKASLIRELKEQAEKQGSSFIHLQLSEQLLASSQYLPKTSIISDELKRLVNELLGKQSERVEEKSSQPKIIIYIDPVDEFAEKYLNQQGVSRAHNGITELAGFLRSTMQKNDFSHIQKMSFVLPLEKNGSTIGNIGTHNRISMLNGELQLEHSFA